MISKSCNPTTRRLAPIFVLWGAVLVACGGPSNRGAFDLDDVRMHNRCFEQAFPFEPTFFAARKRIDSVGIFLQDRANINHDGDLVYFELFEPDEITDASEPVAFEYPSGPDSSARGEVAVETTCDDLNASFALNGRIQIDRLDTDRGGRVEGELVEGTIVDARSGEVVVGSISGTWSFENKTTSPWDVYTRDRDEYPTGP